MALKLRADALGRNCAEALRKQLEERAFERVRADPGMLSVFAS